MSYFPILAAPGCSGWTTLCNFAPNNWEVRARDAKLVCVSWAHEGRWRSETLGKLPYGEMRTVTSADIAGTAPAECLPLLSLRRTALDRELEALPRSSLDSTVLPVWRATVGLSTDQASTSYQGEIDPFPPQASLLTFCPLIQPGESLRNYLLFVNAESSPITRTSQLEIFDAATAELKGTFEVRNNRVSVVPLDDLQVSSSELPLLLCRDMGAVPLYFSTTSDRAFLSLEHTHPPASYVIHGKRWEAQKKMKQHWFARTSRTPA
jgi:hypothetical protein